MWIKVYDGEGCLLQGIYTTPISTENMYIYTMMTIIIIFNERKMNTTFYDHEI